MGSFTSKSSSSGFQRTKSFRSSQRSVLQKLKNKLTKIEKSIEDTNVDREELKIALEKVEEQLKTISSSLKEHNRAKYDKLLEHYEELKNRLLLVQKSVEKTEAPTTPAKLTEEKVIAEKMEFEEENVEMRKTPDEIEELSTPNSPRVKFGIQVLPITPRVSQELLKRKTYPANERAKAEFEEIRSVSMQPTLNGNGTLKERINSVFEVELIGEEIDDLEIKLKYFTGKRGDSEYLDLYQNLTRNLIKLFNLEAEDAVAKHEKKIVVRRVQELISILEKLVECDKKKENTCRMEENIEKCCEVQKEVVNVEGQPIPATLI